MAGEAYYNTGTATVAANSKTVTGTGTNWLSAVGGLTAIKAGDKFGIHVGRPIIIASVDSNTQLTLEDNWPGPAQTNAAYKIELTNPDVIAVEAMRRLLGSLGSGVLYGLSQLPSTPSRLLGIDENGFAALLATIPNAQLPTRLRSASTRIADWDTALESGFYFGDDTTLNTPTQPFSFVGVVTAYTPTYLVQRLVAVGNPSPANNIEFVRQRDNGTFGPWGRVRSTQAEMDNLYNAKLGFTPVQQGGTNKVILDWQSPGRLGLQIDGTDFDDVWPISITGNINGLGTQVNTTDPSSNKLMLVGAFGLGGQSIYLDNTRNLNYLGDQGGLYHWWGTDVTPVNAPETFCTMLHIVHSGGAYTQIVFRLSGEIYHRAGTGGVFTDWKRTDGDVSGPAVAIDNAPVGFSGTSGKVIKQLTGPVAALHAVTGAANKLAYFTGAAAMATTDLTDFARTLLDDASGAAMFATMGATFSGTSAAGSAKLPSGLELKWGTSVNSLSDYRQLFPIAFANDCFVALPVNTFDYSGAGDRFIGASTSNIDKNGFDIRARNIANGGGVAGQGNVPVRWLAVGW